MFKINVNQKEVTTPSTDAAVNSLTYDVIPTINPHADKRTLCSVLETINSILKHGEVHQKVKCVDDLTYASCSGKDPEVSKKFSNALVKSKIFGKESSFI